MIATQEIEIIESNPKSSFAKINSCGLIGVNGYAVEIEIDICGALPNFILVGLPDTAINESRERVRSAIKSSGLEFQSKKIVVNLAPTDTKKAGPTYDLPIAIGILTCYEPAVINKVHLESLYIVGELGLSGKIRPVNGTLAFVILAKKQGAKGIIIPKENSAEASLIEGINIYPVSNLSETISTINNFENVSPFKNTITPDLKSTNKLNIDFSDVKGQAFAK